MERTKRMIINGGIKLPVGYRFRPTDEELVIYYLKRKVYALPLPASVIPEFDVFQTEPYALPGYVKEKRYFFSIRKHNAFSKAGNRLAGSGYWKSTGKEKPITVSGSNRIVGLRKRLIFNEAKDSHNTKTRWVMHELRLLDSGTIPRSYQVSEDDKEDWAVYRVFQKQSKPQERSSRVQCSKARIVENLEDVKPSFIDFKEESCNVNGGPPQPSSPSCCSEVTINELEQEQEENNTALP